MKKTLPDRIPNEIYDVLTAERDSLQSKVLLHKGHA